MIVATCSCEAPPFQTRGEQSEIVLAGPSPEATVLTSGCLRSGPARWLTDKALFREVNGYCLNNCRVG